MHTFLTRSFFLPDPLEMLKLRIKSKLDAQLALPWAPAECFPSGLRPLPGGSFSRQGEKLRVDFRLLEIV